MGCLRIDNFYKPELKVVWNKNVLTSKKTTKKVRSYYGARYYNPRMSLWLSVDALIYDGTFLAGEHNGGFANSFNHGSYIYCYQNPIRLIDPNGKQVDAIKNGVASGKNVVNDITSSVSREKMSSVKAIVLHRTVSSNASSSINSAKRNKGVPGFHMIIHKDGKTTQLVNTNNRANHVGKIKGDSGTSNFNSIGIEVVGMGYDKEGKNPYQKGYDKVGGVQNWDVLTPQQIESTTQAVNTIMKTYKLSADDIYAHKDVSYKEKNEGGAVFEAIKNRLTELNQSDNKKE